MAVFGPLSFLDKKLNKKFKWEMCKELLTILIDHYRPHKHEEKSGGQNVRFESLPSPFWLPR